jgi:hypothetical protein
LESEPVAEVALNECGGLLTQIRRWADPCGGYGLSAPTREEPLVPDYPEIGDTPTSPRTTTYDLMKWGKLDAWNLDCRTLVVVLSAWAVFEGLHKIGEIS